jgi:hypothetical protein
MDRPASSQGSTCIDVLTSTLRVNSVIPLSLPCPPPHPPYLPCSLFAEFQFVLLGTYAWFFPCAMLMCMFRFCCGKANSMFSVRRRTEVRATNNTFAHTTRPFRAMTDSVIDGLNEAVKEVSSCCVQRSQSILCHHICRSRESLAKLVHPLLRKSRLPFNFARSWT